MTLSSYAVPLMGGGLLMATCYMLGRLGFSILWIGVFVALNIFTSKLWKERERRVIALQHAALREKEVVLAQLKDLPAWVQFPDTERVEWMNKVIYQLWPYIGEYSKKFIKEVVEPQVRAHMPRPFTSFKFDNIDMGDIPLRVGGIKVYTENVGRDRIIMDMDVAYAGDCEFGVSVGVFKGGLRQMQFKGKLRAVLKPLLPKPPMIGGVSVFFLDAPTIDFDLTGLGEFVELPGLITAVRSVVTTQVASICVLPNEIVVPLTADTDVVRLYFPEPDGIVRIRIAEARNLENKDSVLRGKSDPYARVSVGAQNYKTKTVDNSLNPSWDEYFEAVVDQSSGQKIMLDTFDEDPGANDEFLGRMSLDLAVVREKGVVDEWFPLEGVKHGDIRLVVTWLDLSTDISLLGHDDDFHDNLTPLNKRLVQFSDAVLLIYIDNVTNLPSPKRDLEPSPFIQLTVGNETQKTFTRPKTCNPLYQQKFIFFVNNVEQQSLKLEAKDSLLNERPLGDLLIPIRSILKEQNLEWFQQTFHLTLGPHLAPIVLSIRLKFLKYKTSSPTSPTKAKQTRVNPNGMPMTNQTVIPYLSNFDDEIVDNDAAWRKAAFSPGAETVNTSNSVGIIQKAQRSTLFSFGKLNKRRSASSHFEGFLGKMQVTFIYSDVRKNLSVHIQSAQQLHPVSYDGVADPYVSVKLYKVRLMVVKKKTSIVSNSLNPDFDETLNFDIQPFDLALYSVKFDVKDSVNYGWFKRPPIMGYVRFDLGRLKSDEPFTDWLTLMPPIGTDHMSHASVPVSNR